MHNATAEGISRILALLPASARSSRGQSVSSVNSPIMDANERPSSTASSLNSEKGSCHSSGQQQTYACPICSVPFKNLDDLYAHQADVGHIETKQTSDGLEYFCWWKGCNQVSHFLLLGARV